MHRIHTTALAAGLAALALPAGAMAATKDVAVGAPPKGAPEGTSINGFFPKTITVRAGDSVRFTLQGFGVVHFPKRGADVPELALADPAKPVSGANDAAGAPFWFNGQPSLAPNPAVIAPTKSGAPYTGAKAANSGLPMGDGPPKPFVVRFPHAGTFRYADPFHPGVTGTVKVVGRKAKVPSARADRRAAARQVAAALATAKRLAKRSAPANTIIAGPDKGATTLFRFTPANATVKVGQPVLLTMSQGSSENHTFTFSRDLKALEKFAGEKFFGPVFEPSLIYPSDQGQLSYDGTNHGDGFLNTGILGGGQSPAIPRSKTVVFTQPGTYDYLCALHPDMHGKVTVTS